MNLETCLQKVNKYEFDVKKILINEVVNKLGKRS